MHALIKIFVLIVVFICTSCSESNTGDNYSVLEARKVKCPDGTIIEYQPWGKAGLMVSCKIKHGTFIAAEGGRIVIEGEFNMGKPSGNWTWFDETGKVTRRESP